MKNTNKSRKFLVYLVQQGIVNYVEIPYNIEDEREHLMQAVGVDEINYLEVDEKITGIAKEILILFRKHKVLIYVHKTKKFHLIELESYGDESLDVEGQTINKYGDIFGKSSFDYIVLEDDHSEINKINHFLTFVICNNALSITNHIKY